jgi:hypothetical protein
MAHITADRVRDTSTSTSTGNFVVSGTAPTGFRTLSAVLSASDTFYYVIQGQGTSEWEVGTGTYSSANTFARTTVLSSSNSGSAVNFSAGTKDVFLTLAAAKTVQLDNNGAIPGITDDGNLTFTGTARRITGDLSNGTIASRLMFQTSTTNSNTALSAIPSGTGSGSTLQLYNGSDPANASYTAVWATGTESQFLAAQRGTGTYLPMTFYTNGSERMRVATDGSVSVGGNLSSGGTVSMSSSFLRNRIINGSMDIWQRGTSTTATGNTYLADRWVSAFPTGGTVSQETSIIPAGSRYAWEFVASASNAFMQMGQQIEFANCQDLQNTTVSISFMARSVNSNAGSTALTVRTRTIAGVDGSCIFTGTNSDTSVTLTTTWTRYTVTRALPSTFGSLSLEFVLGSHVSGDGIILSQVQLEAGSVATAFERRPITQEIQLCQRYYQKSYAIDVVPGTSTTGGYASNPGHAGGTGNARANIRFATEMRAAPTLAYWDLVGNINRSSTFVSNNTQSNNISSASFNLTGIGTSGFAFNNAGGTGSAGTGAWASACHWTASAEL